MPCACIIVADAICPLVTGQPQNVFQRNCLLSGDGPPPSNPPSLIHIWIYRDNLTGILYPWNAQEASWIFPDGTGLGGSGSTIRACCSLILGSGAPATNPPDTAIIWIYIDVQNGVLYEWNPETVAWIDIAGGTGGIGTGNNNGIYWGNGAPVSNPTNIYVDNLYVDIDNGLIYWWSWAHSAWE